MKTSIPVIDIFAGCGGFSEGFNALHQENGFPFDVRLHIERECAPISTLLLRSFYHQFRKGQIPDCYYQYVSGSIKREELFQRHPQEAAAAFYRCLRADLGADSETAGLVSSRIKRAIAGERNWVLIGGPPCQAYSVIGRVRNQSLNGYDPSMDIRFRLYREYTRIIATHWPAVFVMENVQGLLSAQCAEQSVFEQILSDLRDPARAIDAHNAKIARSHKYRLRSVVSAAPDPAPGDFIVKAENYGVPQARHRVLLLGVRDDVLAEPETLAQCPETISSGSVLNGMPPVRSGLSHQDNRERWVKAVHGILEQSWWNEISPDVQRRINRALATLRVTAEGRGSHRFMEEQSTSQYKPQWFEDPLLDGTLNHEARTHREDDLWRYIFASCVMADRNHPPFRVSDFPEGLLPKHKSTADALIKGNFADRFSVLTETAPSRTVLNHIRKDGHYYIHYDPAQCRSLTVREAARLQTFPDNFFFEGCRTDQYGQVGNAVPPLLSHQIAERVAKLLIEG